MKRSILVVLTICLALSTQAQEKPRLKEVGITFRNLDNFGITYRTGTETALWRFNSLAFTGGKNNLYTDSADSYASQLSISVSVGREFRKPITEKLTFRYGVDLKTNFSGSFSEYDDKSIANADRIDNRFYISPGLQAIVGLNYTLNNNLVFGAELLPSIGYNILVDNGSRALSIGRNSWNYGLSSSNLLLSIAYQF